MARRSTKRTCSPPSLPDHMLAVGLRCGKANSKALLPDHRMAVGLRCGKANTKTPRSLSTLDPLFSRDSSGRSILFPTKEESTRVATSSPFSKRPNGKELSRVDLLLPPTRAPFLKNPTGSAGRASSSRTLTHQPTVIRLSRYHCNGKKNRQASGDVMASSRISWTSSP